jgi:hypothetical protein
MDIQNITLDDAVSMCPSIKPQVTNFAHFYIPPNLDGSNGEYELPPNTELYAYGDIHGDFGLLETLLLNVSKVAVKNADGTYDWARPDCWVVLVGDMVDRDRGGTHTFKQPVNIGLGRQLKVSMRGLGEGEDDVGQIQDLLNCLTLKGHTEGNNNKIIKVIGNHDIAITSSIGNGYYNKYTSKYSKDMYERYYNTLSAADKLKYSADYRKYCYTELAQKLIGGNAHLICRVGRWVFVHGGIVDRVIDSIKTLCVDTNMLGTKPDGSPLDTHDYITKLNQFYIRMLRRQKPGSGGEIANGMNTCFRYLAINEPDNSPLYNRDVGFAGDMELLRHLPQDPMFHDKWHIEHVCSNVEDSLNNLLNIVGTDNHLVVAHCIQNQNEYRYAESVGKVYEFRDNNPISASDAERAIYASPGKPIDNVRKGINYICPSTDPREGGKIWRIDCGMSRAFSNLENFNAYGSEDEADRYDFLRSCRPQCLMIQHNPEELDKYLTYVLLGKQGLNISPLLAALPANGGLNYVNTSGTDQYNFLHHFDDFEMQADTVDDPYFGLPSLDEYIPPPAPLTNNNHRPPRSAALAPISLSANANNGGVQTGHNTGGASAAPSLSSGTLPRNNSPTDPSVVAGPGLKLTFKFPKAKANTNKNNKQQGRNNKNNNKTKKVNKNNKSGAAAMNMGQNAGNKQGTKRKGPNNNNKSGGNFTGSQTQKARFNRP